jgi:hypothetical protein
VYSFLSCHGSNPCWGWLNSNETWRNMTTNHANSLNNVYPTVRRPRARVPLTVATVDGSTVAVFVYGTAATA